jgi:hypothetical protein
MDSTTALQNGIVTNGFALEALMESEPFFTSGTSTKLSDYQLLPTCVMMWLECAKGWARSSAEWLIVSRVARRGWSRNQTQHMKKSFYQTLFKTVPSTLEKLLQQRSKCQSCFKRNSSLVKLYLKNIKVAFVCLIVFLLEFLQNSGEKHYGALFFHARCHVILWVAMILWFLKWRFFWLFKIYRKFYKTYVIVIVDCG